MENEEKITQQSKDFIVNIIKEYKKLGETAEINISIGTTRRKVIDLQNKILYVNVLSQREADMLMEMKHEVDSQRQTDAHVNKKDIYDFDWDKIYEDYNKQREWDELLASLENFESREKRAKVQKDSKKKVTIKNKARILVKKAYKMAEKTKAKAKKVKKFLEINGKESKDFLVTNAQKAKDFFVHTDCGKKAISYILAIGLSIGVAAYTVDSAMEGCETFEKYGSVSEIENQMKGILTNEFKKSLNNDDIMLDLDIINLDEDGITEVRIKVTDPNDSRFNMTFNINDIFELGNPSYIRKIANQFIVVDDISVNTGGKITDAINKARAGHALNKTKKLAEENDIVINNDLIGQGKDLDRVPERMAKESAETERG